ncbi:TetR/AcrR family transcriptional regulator C-terminal domain-containing protein [Saccharomonospora sp. NPDC046836]|uniref:TetR/AcrR family transcriptional regulator C-terminal domain-containing protein n=1 Tax=Saccharomonospora sp. NPDC046836 TaxID=3156921 RepID=UPI0033CA7462
MEPSIPPYLRIVSAIRDRIADGELRPGDRVPSARQLVRDWGVAMATATKALATLRHEGLVEARTGVGTVVRTGRRPPQATQRAATAEATLTRQRVVRAGIAVADAEGLDALSMRRVAAELGAGAMSLYRHVAGKHELVLLMARAVFRELPLPDQSPEGWRARLELVCRIQWELFRRHPWLASLISVTRPMLMPEAMAHTEWTLDALGELGLSERERAREAITLPAFVRGLALSAAAEADAERRTGLTNQQWWHSLEHEVGALVGSGRFPQLARFPGDVIHDVDALFAHGLARHLNGLEAATQRARKQPTT